MQLDQKKRGFSFMKDGPLDMRMDKRQRLTAQEIVNTWSEKEIADVIREYGEDPRWKKAAKAIVTERKKSKFETTKQLADFIQNSLGRIGGKKIHPATLIFQALRICVNRELDSVQEGIKNAMKMLTPGGKMGVISFHSLEDRIVKNLFRESSTPLRKIFESREVSVQPIIENLTKKPIVATRSEVKKNPRSRSAKMRFVQKI